jgi:squalene-hopene/tetraprenyl-beta-curcumene cyclase
MMEVTMKSISRSLICLLLTSVVGLGLANQRLLGDETKKVGPDQKQLDAVRSKAIRYLKLSQASDGTWTAPNVPGITALTVTALLKSGVSKDDPVVAKSLKFLESLKQKNGGIYHAQTLHRNYETSISVLAFSAANSDGKYTETIKDAEKFLRDLQWDKGEGLESDDAGFGGAGYGKHQRPDLSNTQFLLDALKEAGVKADDPAMQKALTFVSRCQNLESSHNNTKFAALIEDGGFYYTPAAGGTSQAGLAANGGLRSYGSMTYAGLKSMIFAGVKLNDPRAKAAFKWIQKHYTLDLNPGMGKQGLYYYYHTFAKSLTVMKVDWVEDSKGVKHDWRKELTANLAKQQQPNGSWTNSADRWYEGDPNLVTAYSLMALSYCDTK